MERVRVVHYLNQFFAQVGAVSKELVPEGDALRLHWHA